MKKIALLEYPHPSGFEKGFYRLHTADGKLSDTGISGSWYEAEARDESDNLYRVVWEISNYDAFYESGELYRDVWERFDYDAFYERAKDCCDWSNPAEIYSYKDKKPVEAVIDTKYDEWITETQKRR